jgi:DNA-binding GntR family transcriptional regulator
MTLSDTVYADLAARIESGGAPPAKLTFAELAKYYGVSLTPVRKAVERLLDEGFLVTCDNGRLAVSEHPPKRPAAARQAAVEPPRDREAEILADIIRLSLSGEPHFFREAAAAERYGIGRTVLRPLLARLTGQGLIEHVPRRGWRVRPFDRKDLRDFLVVRETLELTALEAARDKLDNNVLNELLEGNRERDGALSGGLNNNLHAYWIGLSGNRYISEFFERQARYYTTLFDFAAPEAHVVREMAAEHCAILEPLIAGRFDEAKQALVRHIRDQQPIVERLIEQIQSEAAEGKG